MALKYETKTPILGIDVSKYQGNVDWAQVKAAGYAFAFVRLGYANGDGSIVADPYFERNLTGAAAAGLDVGVYLYSYIDSEDHARMAAARALELLAGRALSLPLVLDYEHAASIRNSAGQRTPPSATPSWPASRRRAICPCSTATPAL